MKKQVGSTGHFHFSILYLVFFIPFTVLFLAKCVSIHGNLRVSGNWIAGRSLGKNQFPKLDGCGPQAAFRRAMSSLDLIYRKMASSLEQNGGGHMQEPRFDSTRHMPSAVAHELNNILTIIQGYADRLRLKHGENPAIEPQLKLIVEAARRATLIVRDATPPNRKRPTPSEENSLTPLVPVG